MSGASDDGLDVQDGGEANKVSGASPQESMRRDSPVPREEGLIAQMEREAEEARLGGWFNRNPEDVPESWSGTNCHRNDFSGMSWNGLNFFELFKLYFFTWD